MQGLPTLLVLVKGYGTKKGHSHEVPKAKAAPYKRPASKPDTPMSLEEKMELFAKSKQQNVTQFLDQETGTMVQSLLETMKANLHFAREYTRTQNIMNRHGSDARRPDWFDI